MGRFLTARNVLFDGGRFRFRMVVRPREIRGRSYGLGGLNRNLRFGFVGFLRDCLVSKRSLFGRDSRLFERRGIYGRNRGNPAFGVRFARFFSERRSVSGKDDGPGIRSARSRVGRKVRSGIGRKTRSLEIFPVSDLPFRAGGTSFGKRRLRENPRMVRKSGGPNVSEAGSGTCPRNPFLRRNRNFRRRRRILSEKRAFPFGGRKRRKHRGVFGNPCRIRQKDGEPFAAFRSRFWNLGICRPCGKRNSHHPCCNNGKHFDPCGTLFQVRRHSGIVCRRGYHDDFRSVFRNERVFPSFFLSHARNSHACVRSFGSLRVLSETVLRPRNLFRYSRRDIGYGSSIGSLVSNVCHGVDIVQRSRNPLAGVFSRSYGNRHGFGIPRPIRRGKLDWGNRIRGARLDERGFRFRFRMAFFFHRSRAFFNRNIGRCLSRVLHRSFGSKNRRFSLKVNRDFLKGFVEP